MILFLSLAGACYVLLVFKINNPFRVENNFFHFFLICVLFLLSKVFCYLQFGLPESDLYTLPSFLPCYPSLIISVRSCTFFLNSIHNFDSLACTTCQKTVLFLITISSFLMVFFICWFGTSLL